VIYILEVAGLVELVMMIWSHLRMPSLLKQVVYSWGSLAIPWHQPRSGRRHHFGWFRHDPSQSIGPLSAGWLGWWCMQQLWVFPKIDSHQNLGFLMLEDLWGSRNCRNSQFWYVLMWLWTVLVSSGLFGAGVYFAESVSKADEYVKGKVVGGALACKLETGNL